jgi:hypothetical protein
MTSTNTFEVLSAVYRDGYKTTKKRDYLIYLDLVNLLNDNGYFEVCNICQSHSVLVIAALKNHQHLDHTRVTLEIFAKDDRCEINVDRFMGETLLVINSTSFQIDDMRLFQFGLLLFLSQYIKQTKEFRKREISEYLLNDSSAEV